jgi:hypothetical protein
VPLQGAQFEYESASQLLLDSVIEKPVFLDSRISQLILEGISDKPYLYSNACVQRGIIRKPRQKQQ